jgi:ABC-2 type transport system permease protein
MTNTMTICRRELQSYFSSPLAYLFIAVFLSMSGVFTFSVARFYEAQQAALESFFNWHPWLYLFLVPAISMRLWAEERKSGTIELLLTLPVSLYAAVIGKFLAAWALIAIALFLTFPLLITVNVLGDPDNGVILTAYLGSLLMAGSYLSIGTLISALTRNQVISFVVTVVICFLFLLAGFPIVIDWFVGWAPDALIEAVSSISFFTHFNSISRGVVKMTDLVFFASLMIIGITACTLVLEQKKAD